MNNANSMGMIVWFNATHSFFDYDAFCAQQNNPAGTITDTLNGTVISEDGVQCVRNGQGDWVMASAVNFSGVDCATVQTQIESDYASADSLYFTCQEVPEIQIISWPQAEFYMILLVGFIFFFGVVSMFKRK